VADGDALRAALDALIENAVKHTSASQASRVSSEAAGGMLLIRVADEGSGIPHEALGRIFGRFARADSARIRRLLCRGDRAA
jgi:two-component system, OmpR family, sensor histidine kinase VicK